MKIVRSINNPTDIRKVRNSEAVQLVQNGNFKYASKELWKKEVRDVNKTSVPAV